MAKLDIAEKRLPQDGRISVRVGGKEVDVRVSTIPASNGERVGHATLRQTGWPQEPRVSGNAVVGFERDAGLTHTALMALFWSPDQPVPENQPPCTPV